VKNLLILEEDHQEIILEGVKFFLSFLFNASFGFTFLQTKKHTNEKGFFLVQQSAGEGIFIHPDLEDDGRWGIFLGRITEIRLP
jgi:hypothetical protein